MTRSNSSEWSAIETHDIIQQQIVMVSKYYMMESRRAQPVRQTQIRWANSTLPQGEFVSNKHVQRRPALVGAPPLLQEEIYYHKRIFLQRSKVWHQANFQPTKLISRKSDLSNSLQMHMQWFIITFMVPSYISNKSLLNIEFNLELNV